MKKRLLDKLANTPVDRIISWAYGILDLSVMGAFHDDEGVRLIKQIRKEDALLLCRPSEMYMIYSLANAQRGLPGDYAEVGVYKGATARLICQVKGTKQLHLFDTFAGLPQVDKSDIRFSEKMFAASLDGVKARLANFENVHYYPGLFPTTSGPVTGQRFAMVHLDVDLYQSTKDSLEFFYPRLVPGGILISHDHPTADGVVKAFNEFLADKPEKVIQLPLSQGMIIKQSK